MGSTGIRFTEEQLRRCDEKSTELGISRNEFIRDAVEFYLEWLSRESSEKFLTPALESVFSAVGGWLVLGQVLSVREVIGCTVIFAAIILAQLRQDKTEEQG